MPLPSPSPAATITVMEMMPQAMPNIVSMVRRLWAQSVASVSRSKSWNDMALRLSVRLLQNHFLLLVEAFENLRLHAVGNAQLHAKFFLVVERLHNDARRLTEKNLADIRFIDFALHVDFADVAQRHDQGRLRPKHQDGADRVPDIDVARQHQPVNRANDRR